MEKRERELLCSYRRNASRQPAHHSRLSMETIIRVCFTNKLNQLKVPRMSAVVIEGSGQSCPSSRLLIVRLRLNERRLTLPDDSIRIFAKDSRPVLLLRFSNSFDVGKFYRKGRIGS